MKIALAFPGVTPFVRQTAHALFDAGLLAGYWTTFADQPGARWRRLLVHLASMVDVDLNQELQRRAITEIPLELLRSDPYLEVLRSLLSRFKADPRLVDAVWEHEMLRFDRGVARRAFRHATGIYGYEFSALASFQEAKRLGLPRIYEVPAPEHDFSEGIIQREIDQFPELDDGKRAYFRARQARRTERRRNEWALADVVIAYSTFARDSYAAAGLDVAKVRIAPLGAPLVRVAGESGGGQERKPLRVLWAGTFSVRKGAHYLLAAWKSLAPGKNATLEIYGANALPDRMMDDLPPSVSISPTVPHAALFERYHAADVLVFPTLCDSFGMVVTEAFANGLPVITTSRAGAADLVRHRENGLIIPAADAEALRAALDWCLTHRAELKAMRPAALETAARWQWSDFRRELAGHLIKGLKDKGYPI
jgi:glycosyltransferase involved in cell wall biosynthesis